MTKLHQDTTLGDLGTMDRDNFAHVDSKDSQTFKFPSSRSAFTFMGQCVNQAMRKCGVKIRPGMGHVRIDRMLVSRGVRIEHREYGPDEEDYQSGLFIYKMSGPEDNATRELAFFVSNPFMRQGTIQDLHDVFYVRTNVKGVY